MKRALIISRRPERTDFEYALAELCTARGLTVLLTPDLYSVPEDSAVWSELAALEGLLAAFVWMHPRPAEWLLRHHGIGREGLLTLNLATYKTPQRALEALEREFGRQAHPHDGDSGGCAVRPGIIRELQAPTFSRWYPVRDGSRCTHCLHCVQFCLFGVYETDAQRRVRVAHPDNCKPGCPACARICPASAIMFPRYAADEAIQGAPGKFVTLDADAARMFRKRIASRSLESQPGPTDEASDLLAEIDALIDELDARMGRRHR